MRRHFAWRPHLDRDPLFNPFVPAERRPIVEHDGGDEGYSDEVEAYAVPVETGSPEEVPPPTKR